MSASNIDSVEILHNGTSISDDGRNHDFEMEYSNCTGSYKYDLQTAKLLQVWWRVENRSLTCAQIQSYDGEYVCRGSATTAEEEGETRSDILYVQTLCKTCFLYNIII